MSGNISKELITGQLLQIAQIIVSQPIRPSIQ